MLGTPRYMSPEQARGETAGAASDVFSLAVVLYELATGRHPFEADSTLAMLHAITSSIAAPALRWVPDLPPVLDRLLMQMLDKSARRTSLGRAHRGGAVGTIGLDRRTRERRRWRRAAERRTHNLPPQRTALVGRSAEIASVKDLLLGTSVQAAHADRTGRHRQDTPRDPGGRGPRRSVRWRRVREPRAARRPWSGRVGGRTRTRDPGERRPHARQGDCRAPSQPRPRRCW